MPRSDCSTPEAASIALFERDPGRLEFKVKHQVREEQAPLAQSVKPRPRESPGSCSRQNRRSRSRTWASDQFDRKTAEKTGYVPRSIAAVPLTDEQGTHGVPPGSSTSAARPRSTCGTWS